MHLVRPGASECSDLKNGRSCRLRSSPNTVRVVDDQIFVGATDWLEAFSMDLRESEAVQLPSEEAAREHCLNQLFHGTVECRNHIRSIITFPAEMQERRVLVCGTNAFRPLCRLHDPRDPATYTELTPNSTDAGYSPYFQNEPIVSLVASNGRFFSGTRFDEVGVKLFVRMSPEPLQLQGPTFTVGTPQSDPRWLNQPTYISIHEHGEHIYFFLNEPAFELTSTLDSNPLVEEVRYPRVVRVCKTDEGIGSGTDPTSNLFRTFQKARLECSVSGERGSNPFHYNDLQSTFMSQSESRSVLYGVFNSPTNGPAGGAICKFSFDETEDGSITEVLDEVSYLVQQTDSPQTLWVRRDGSPFSCPGSPGMQRSLEEAENYLLKFNSVTSSPERPLVVASGEFLDKVVVETLTYRGQIQEVVYYTNQQGDIKQVVVTSDAGGGDGDSTSQEHTIHSSSSPIKDLVLHQSVLYATTDDSLLRIPRGDCSAYADCFACFDSRDAHCGWDTVRGACTNKLENPDRALVEVFSAEEARIVDACGTRPPAPQATVDPPLPCDLGPQTGDNSKVEVSTNEGGGQDCNTSKPPVVGPVTDGLQAEIGSVSIGIIVGATIAAFVLGVPVGGLLCLLFYRRFSGHRPRSGKAEITSPEAHHQSSSGTGSTSNNNSTAGTATTSFNNSNQIKEVVVVPSEGVQPEKKDLAASLQLAAPPPRYVQTNPKPVVATPPPPAPAASTQSNHIMPATPLNNTVPHHHSHLHNHQNHIAATPPSEQSPHKHPNINTHISSSGTSGGDGGGGTSSSKKMDLMNQQQQSLEEVGEDDAFLDKDTVAPLRTFATPGTMYGSLGRHKTKTAPNGVARKQVPGYKVPRGRTDSTTWLRQRSESLSSDISCNTSPLQSPISDV